MKLEVKIKHIYIDVTEQLFHYFVLITKTTRMH